jgi:hypothetical protein
MMYIRVYLPSRNQFVGTWYVHHIQAKSTDTHQSDEHYKASNPGVEASKWRHLIYIELWIPLTVFFPFFI